MTEEHVAQSDRVKADLQGSEQEEACYSARVLEEARHPRNLGVMLEPDGHAVVCGPCGDMMEIFLRLKESRIKMAAFMTDGCASTLACGSMLTTMARGMTLDQAAQIEPADVIAALDGLPAEQVHCATLAVNTLREAIAYCRRENGTGPEQMSTHTHGSRMQPVASRAAWASIAVNVTLSLLNLAIATASGSLAVAAEVVHNLVDLVASVAVLAGVKISQRKSQAFPYGLYKVENVVAVGVAIMIFLTGYEIAQQAFRGVPSPATVNGWMLAGVALSAIIPLAFSFYEMGVGRALNSPSLIAEAQEYRVHVFSSGLVFLALAAQRIGVSLDRYAALLIVVLITKTGWELLTDGMRVLLDASLDAGTLAQVRAILEAEPAVTAVRSLAGRNAGRYRFLEANVALRVSDLEKAHIVNQRLEAAVRAHVPRVERVRIHCEPESRTHLRYAVPLADANGTVSQHFGEAPYFGLVTVRAADHQVERQEVLANPYVGVEKAKGIRVGEWLVSLKTDVVLLREDVHGRGPAYVFADAGVETRLTQATTLAQALAQGRE